MCPNQRHRLWHKLRRQLRQLPRRIQVQRPVSFPNAILHRQKTLTPFRGITISIYGSSGLPDNGGKAYTVPGPAVLTCGASTGGSTPVASSPSTSSPTAVTGGGTGTVALYGQCGGSGYTGATTCASGTCKKSNDYYSKFRYIPQALNSKTQANHYIQVNVYHKSLERSVISRRDWIFRALCKDMIESDGVQMCTLT